ncbi:MAG: rhamnulokinase [Candidatus Humimicrobiaceae bacterium]
MAKTKNFLAFDYGASNGRAIVGKFNGRKIELEEVYRFDNRPVYADGVLYWDILRLYSELKIGLTSAFKKCSDVESIGIDTWGCDFALLDRDRNLLSNPVHYRDKRTIGMRDAMSQIIPEHEIYKKTQAQILEIAALYQLFYLRTNKKKILENARYYLMIGDLLNYYLSGEIVNEYTNATTSIAFDQKNKKWEKNILNKLGIPTDIFKNISEPGTVIGKVRGKVCEELKISRIPVALPAYDTAGEIFAVPISNINKAKNWAYLNCGTWAMVGMVLDDPLVNKKGYEERFGNEGGPFNKYHFLTNIAGTWPIQQSRKKWNEESGFNIAYDEIMEAAINSEEKDIFINLEDSSFEKDIFDMPGCIRDYCRNTNQQIPESVGDIARVFYESLALKYASSVKKLNKISGRKIELLHLVGGGSKDRLICQNTANASGLPVIAGPAETTTMGNLVVQAIAMKEIGGVEEARDVINNSANLTYYEPRDLDKWQSKVEKFNNLF